jgi:hypothetical protein
MLRRCPAPYKIRDMCGASAGHVRDILLFSVWQTPMYYLLKGNNPWVVEALAGDSRRLCLFGKPVLFCEVLSPLQQSGIFNQVLGFAFSY